MTLDSLRFAVLDEVDRMLDIGFRDDIRRILGQVKHPHQTVFVSATIDDEIKRLTKQYMHDPEEINVSEDVMTVDLVEQWYCVVDPWDKFQLLKLLLEQEKPKLTIIFCNTKHGARKLAQRLHAAGMEAREIHGDLVQQKREKIMERFRKHQIPLLVATDLAARGIDVHEITHIVNYDLPQDIQVYVHRVGRTARMGATGKAYTFVTREEGPDLTKIEMMINKQLIKLEIPGFEPRGAPDAPATAGRTAGSSPQPVAASTLAAPSAPVSAVPAPTHYTGKVPLSRRKRR